MLRSPLASTPVDRRREAAARALLCVAAAVPFVPDALEFVRRGLPDVLFTGDAATIELRTRQAAHGLQLVGAYSRFGLDHPGPLFFYLAAPLYELSGERGPALNLFVFTASLSIAIALVLTARKLRGKAFAFSVAALLAVYEIVVLPPLLASEWNPFVPILPLALLAFLSVRSCLGATWALPVCAFLASFVVQTHLGFAPEALALCAVALLGLRKRASWKEPAAAAVVLAMCWALPLAETIAHPPGNLRKLAWFFAKSRLPHETWSSAVVAVAGQMAAFPVALVECVVRRPFGAPAPGVALTVACAEVAAIVVILLVSFRRGDAVLQAIAAVALVQVVAAIVAVHSIRGGVFAHLVAWATLPGLFCFVALAACAATARARSVALPFGAAILLVLASTAPVGRVPPIPPRDPTAEDLARSVERQIVSKHVAHPVIDVATPETWPTAVALVLYLSKRGVDVSVARGFAPLVGTAFAEPPGIHPRLLVGGDAFAAEAAQSPDLSPLARAGDVYVFLQRRAVSGAAAR